MERKSSKEYSDVFLVEGEKFISYEICPEEFHVCFLHGRKLVLFRNNRVNEVFKGFKVHDFEYCGQRNYILKWKSNLCH